RSGTTLGASVLMDVSATVGSKCRILPRGACCDLERLYSVFRYERFRGRTPASTSIAGDIAARDGRESPDKEWNRVRRTLRKEVNRGGSRPSGKGPAEYFTGAARVDPLFEPPEPARVAGAHVTFEPGARTAWQTHRLGQTLIVSM